jgi:hypothetical protein
MALPPRFSNAALDGGPRIPASFIFNFQMPLCAKAYTDGPPISRDGKTRGSSCHAPLADRAIEQCFRNAGIDGGKLTLGS